MMIYRIRVNFDTTLLIVGWIIRSTHGELVRRIVGGKIIRHQLYPWMASLRYHETHHCGGVILDRLYIATAAHCSYDDGTEYWTIAVPKQDNAKPSHSLRNPHIYKVKWQELHPEYNIETYANDLAIWGSQGELPEIKHNIKLSYIEPEEGIELNILGWGRTYRADSLADFRPKTSATLRLTQIPILSIDNCSAAYPDVHLESQFCAGFSRGGKDGCDGDSGGPIFDISPKNSNITVLLGIMSSGAGCAEANLPGVYTKATVLRDFVIMTKMKYPNLDIKRMRKRKESKNKIILSPDWEIQY